MENILKEKSFAFALRVVKLSRYLMGNENEYVLSKQVLRSGTAVGALVCEAEFAQSKPDFVSKMSIALKEASETRYWIKLLYESNFITEAMFTNIQPDINDLSRVTGIERQNRKARQQINFMIFMTLKFFTFHFSLFIRAQ